jgi:hypothetical protein
MIQPEHGFNPLLMRYLPELFGFEVKARSLYEKTDYISLLVNASILNTYAEGMSNVSRKLRNHTPTGETALAYFKSIDRLELQSSASIVLEAQVDELKRKGLLSRSVPIAFDWHDEMFYGDEKTEMVNGTNPKAGSSYAYQFLTASVLVDGRRLTVVLMPIRSRRHLLDYVKDALNRIRNAGILVRYLLFDRGFSSLELPAFLEANCYLYAILFTPNSVTKRMNLRDGQSAVYPCDRPFRIVRADDKEKKRRRGKRAGPLTYLFATNMTCKARRILRRYKDRWGVETSYRKHNEFLAKTTSKNYTVRLLYYAVSICIYNVWCLFNVHRRHVIALEAKVRLLLSASSFLATAMALLRP